MPVSQDAKAALYAQETGEVFLEIITISGAGIDPIHLVNNTQAIVSNGITYQASRFNVLFPNGKLGSGTKSTIELSNVDRRPVEMVLSVDEPLELTAALIRASAPDVLEQGPIEFTLRQCRWQATTLSADLFDDIEGNIAIPKIHYNSQDFPGLY